MRPTCPKVASWQLTACGRPAHSQANPTPQAGGQSRPVAPSPEAAAYRRVCTGGAADGGVELLRQPERRRCAEADVDMQHGTLIQR